MGITPDTTCVLVFLKLPEVCHRTGLSRSELFRRVSANEFPAPVKLGTRSSVWPAHEIQAWGAARIAERDALSNGLLS